MINSLNSNISKALNYLNNINIELINIAKRKKITSLNLYKSIGGGWQ